MNPLRYRRGQALIESVLSLPLLALGMTAILTLGYRGLVFYMTDYHLHEALVCLDDESSSTCKKNLEQQIKSVLLFSESFRVNLGKTESKGDGEVLIQFKPDSIQPNLSVRKEMKFPLGSSFL
ncbi:hypothetical protein [Bdellovibrio sp. HCB2-146]|uniref:hypothetical protein n=1 Tax=Bdellovibrio sp. HCB2-146 TaxID=3394362 RepID=UPI0039BCBB98